MMFIKSCRYILLYLLIINIPVNTTAAVVVSGSSPDSLERALNSAAPGDTVMIPEGYYRLSRSLLIVKPLFLKGAGESKTILSHAEGTKEWLLRVDLKVKGKIRISGMAFEGKAPQETPGILMLNDPADFRIDNCRFVKCSRRAVEVHGDSRGLIDHNVFIDNWYTAVVVFGNGTYGWKKPFRMGDSEAVFVEDNYFQQRTVPDISMAHHIASNNGSRYVFRYNTIADGDIASHAVDAHGNKYGWERGSRGFEIYGNRISAVHRWAGINIRGGDGVIFDNVFEGDFVSPVHLMHEGRTGDGKCDYPCIDQVRELYIWGNTYKGKKFDIRVRHPEIIQAGRDYFLQKKAGYVPYRYPHLLAEEKKGL